MDVQKFLNDNRSMVCAPAGYGKTHTIVQCIKENTAERPTLILTHTNAGVNSIRDKLKGGSVDSSRYELSTICGFQEQLVASYVKNKTLIPEVTDSQYYSIVAELAFRVANTKIVQHVLLLKYSHIIVDEFQDCSVSQLTFIEKIGNNISVHVLCDPLQSIYGFKDRMVNIYGEECIAYRTNMQTLNTPWRWDNANRHALGQELHVLRNRILSKECINLLELKQISVKHYPEIDKFQHGKKTEYSKFLWSVCGCRTSDSILVLAPVDEQYNYRQKLVQIYHGLTILESVDDKDFYDYAHDIDTATPENSFAVICKIVWNCFKHSPIEKYIKEDGSIVKKRSKEEQKESEVFVERKIRLRENFSLSEILDALKFFEQIPEMRVYRKHIISDLKTAITKAILNKVSVFDAMKDLHNKRKRAGQRILSKHIGTTLLTKGLEFDHVIVLDAHKMKDARNFYVAITRGCKSVTIISDKMKMVSDDNYKLTWE